MNAADEEVKTDSKHHVMDAAEGPELATVIPVYNEVEHIKACLLSFSSKQLNLPAT